MKKRWIVMLLATISASVILATNMKSDAEISVKVLTLTPRRIEQTVSCAGIVEAADGVPVLAPMSCYIKSVAVKKGQRVKKGDLLAVIDLDATREAIADPAQLLVLATLKDRLTAPEDGVVLSVKAKANQKLDLGTPCAVIARDRDVQLRIGIREKDLKKLKRNMTVRVKGEGFQKEGYMGKLAEISSTARTDATSGTVVEGVVILDDGEADASLRLGLNAKAMVIVSVTENGLVIPYEAIMSDEQGDYVYICKDERASKYRLPDHSKTVEGVMVTDAEWEGVKVVLQPDCITEGLNIQPVEDSV